MSAIAQTKTVRRLRALAESHGLTVLDINKGRHYKIRVQAPDGRETLIIAGATISDSRAELNQDARFKRFANGRDLYDHVVPPIKRRNRRKD